MRVFRLMWLLLVAALACAALGVRAQELPPRILMISVDGLMPSRYTKPGPAKIPAIRRLMAEGAYAEGVVGVLPTVTYPSHTTLVTGVTPAIHGIVDNRILDPEDRSNRAWYWYVQNLRAPTLAGAAKARGLTTAAVSWPVTVGADIDFLFPEYFRSDHRETLNLLRALSTPHLLDDVERATGQPLPWPFNDRPRADIAKFILQTHQPHVMLVHFIDTDAAQHDFGPDSARVLESHERVDGHIGELLDVLDRTKLRAQTIVAVVSDHGFRPLEKQLQPNFVFKREGLIKTDAGGRIVDWQAYFHSSGGAGFVYLKNPRDAALRERVHALLKPLAADKQNGIAALWTASELATRGAHPEAAFGLSMERGFYSSTAHDTLLKSTTSKGGHGFDPSTPDLHASLVLAGPGVPKGRTLGIVRMTQIAPTLARILGVGLSPHADKPIELGAR